MLRAAVVALLLANLLFFAWARGWFGAALPPPHHGEREPERLAAQVHPELVRILPPGSAPRAAAPAATRCLEAGPFTDAEVGVAESLLAGAGVPANAWTRQPLQQGPSWLVYMGRFADATALQAKEAEIRRLKLEFEEVKQPPELAPGLALSRHDNRAAAESALAQVAQRGVRTARVVALPPPPLQHWLRVQQADAAMQATLAGLGTPPLTQPFAPCVTR